MSEETPEATEAQPDKPDNNANLRQQLEAAKAEAEELRAFKVNEIVRGVNLDPNEGNGAALKEMLGSDASEERAQELVTKFGWQAEGSSSEAPELTKEERAAQEFANRQSELQSVTTSGEPQADVDQQITDLQARLQAARAAQNWDDVKAIGNQLMQLNTAKMRASVATHV